MSMHKKAPQIVRPKHRLWWNYPLRSVGNKNWLCLPVVNQGSKFPRQAFALRPGLVIVENLFSGTLSQVEGCLEVLWSGWLSANRIQNWKIDPTDVVIKDLRKYQSPSQAYRWLWHRLQRDQGLYRYIEWQTFVSFRSVSLSWKSQQSRTVQLRSSFLPLNKGTQSGRDEDEKIVPAHRLQCRSALLISFLRRRWIETKIVRLSRNCDARVLVHHSFEGWFCPRCKHIPVV